MKIKFIFYFQYETNFVKYVFISKLFKYSIYMLYMRAFSNPHIDENRVVHITDIYIYFLNHTDMQNLIKITTCR